jgi:hypothetical protein
MRLNRNVIWFAALGILALVLGGCGIGSSATSPPTPTPTLPVTPLVSVPTTSTETTTPFVVATAPFVIPTVLPSPVAAQPTAASPCKGSACMGKDPDKTGCTTGAYTQETATISDSQKVLGVLELRGNHNGCDSTQWARFTPAQGVAFTFALRVIQDRTGLATEWRSFPNRNAQAWSWMIHSPGPRVRAQIGVPDGKGGWNVIGQTDPQ